MNLIHRLNAKIIDIVLVIFYFVGIGTAKILYLFLHAVGGKKNTYWQNKEKTDHLDIISPY